MQQSGTFSLNITPQKTPALYCQRGLLSEGDYLCDLGAAMSKAAQSFGLRGQALPRFPEISGVRLRELCLYLIGEVVQDADAVLCGLQVRAGKKKKPE